MTFKDVTSPWAVVGALVVAALTVSAGVAVVAGGPAPPTPVDATAQFDGQPTRIDLPDQTTDGGEVTVADAAAAGSAFFYIVVWSTDENGSREDVLGVTQVPNASASNVEVALSPPVAADVDLVATLAPDSDGDPRTDDPVVDTVLARDRASVSVAPGTAPLVTIPDQNSTGGSITVGTVENTTAPTYAGVWAVDNTTGAPTTLLGVRQVTGTRVEGLSVSVPGELDRSRRLLAAVHPDRDGLAGTFDPNFERFLAIGTANVSLVRPVGASVRVDDQTSDGLSATVTNATNATAPFYIGVLAVEDDGTVTGDLLSRRQVNATGVRNVTLNFRRGLNENTTIAAVVFPDADGRAVTANDPVTTRFRAIDTASLTVELPRDVARVSFPDQRNDGTTVRVRSVTVPQGGFVVVREAGTVGDDPDGVLGVSEYLVARETENVTVGLDQSLNGSQSLVAVVHRDTDNDRLFDFVASNGTLDPPYRNAARDPVADPATVTVVSFSSIPIELFRTTAAERNATETDESVDTDDGSLPAATFGSLTGVFALGIGAGVVTLRRG